MVPYPGFRESGIHMRKTERLTKRNETPSGNPV
jgi:hypothetical protein